MTTRAYPRKNKKATPENVVAISKMSLGLGELLEPVKYDNMGRNSLKNSNLRVFAAGSGRSIMYSSLIQDKLQGIVANLVLKQSMSPLIKYYKKSLIWELERYDAIPFHLAFLYLLLKPETVMYFGDYAVKSPAGDKKRLQFSKNGEVVAYTYKDGLDKAHKFTPQSMFTFKPEPPTKGYYYAQNENLVRVINFLVAENQKVDGGISPTLIYTYLFFNKDAQVNQKPAKGNSGNPTNIKYDPQSKLIKTQITVGSKKYSIHEASEVMEIWDGTGKWRHMDFSI